ncbi:MAG: hypothetical protein K8T20_01200 [Planctomycetes bacterium]|nr:hypothetical protein [Planctomycetota bacterium]
MKRALPFAAVALLAAAALADDSDLGPKFQVFPADNPWHWDISGYKVHPNSAKFVESIGADGTMHADWGTDFGIPYCVVTGKQAKQKIVEWEYGDECDKDPYPIPDKPPIEGGPDAGADGDRHVLIVDRDNMMLYELWHVFPVDDGKKKGWKAGSGAIFNLRTNDRRKEGWTSADAAGLSVFAGLVRYEEVDRGVIDHAIRFTVRKSAKKYWFPASHHAGRADDPNLPPMGMRVRLKASFDDKGFGKQSKVVIAALKKYGGILADNGSDWFFTGAVDKRWKDDDLNGLKKVKGSDFEVIESVDAKGKPILPPGMKAK